MTEQIGGAWRTVTGSVETVTGAPVDACHVGVEPIAPPTEVLEVAVFSDHKGQWSHLLRADASFDLVAALKPGEIIGRVRVWAGQDDLTGVRIVLDI